MYTHSFFIKKIITEGFRAKPLLLLFTPLLVLFGGLIIYDFLSRPPVKRVKDPDLIGLFDEMSHEISNKKMVEKWLKKNWNLYSIDDELMDALKMLCPLYFDNDLTSNKNSLETCIYANLISQLEDSLLSSSSPFQYVSYDLRVSVPPTEYQPDKNIAYTCFDGMLVGRVIRLKGNNLQQFLELYVVGGYTCSMDNIYPDLQLNEKQAWTLFERKLSQVEHINAFML